MSVRLDGDLIRLEGPCRVEEAEALTALLQQARRTVDLSGCEAMHGAVLQVLLAFAAPVEGAPSDPFLRERLIPALRVAAGGKPEATSLASGSKENGRS